MASQQLLHNHPRLHFLFIPLFSPSHIIPISDFAKLLALHHHHRRRPTIKVSIITTPLNALRSRPSIDLATTAGLDIHLIPLQFPGQDAGLPPGCENLDSLSSLDSSMEFFHASALLQLPLENVIQQMDDPKPSCIVSTSALPWTQKVADRFKIPRYIFETVSCFTLLCSRILTQSELEIHGKPPGTEDKFTVPGIPDEIEFTMAQLPLEKPSGRGRFHKLLEEIKEAQMAARGTLVNSFQGLEPWYLEANRKERRNFWCVGPVSLSNKRVEDTSLRGNLPSTEENFCLSSWLDTMEPGSVIYACFGSLSRIPTAQIVEIGLGLEASNYPFIWVIRAPNFSTEVKTWFADEKFEERVRGRGIVIRGWAPQVLILSHPSIGGFLTHCGWNSTLEGVCAGVPMITWPMFAEQFYNEKFIVNVVKMGVKIGVEGGNELVRWDRVSESIKELMEEEKEGKGRIERAKKLKEMAQEAIGEKGSSYLDISLFIDDVWMSLESEGSAAATLY